MSFLGCESSFFSRFDHSVHSTVSAFSVSHFLPASAGVMVTWLWNRKVLLCGHCEALWLSLISLCHCRIFLSLPRSVRLGQPVIEGPDPSQHLAAFPRSQPEVDPHLPAALRPRLRVCGGHRLQQVRPQGDIPLILYQL